MAVEKDLLELKKIVSEAKCIACLTGAGMSTESGIPDFRSPTGVYKTLCSEEVFDLDNFRRHPEDFYQIISPFYGMMRDAKPNAGHLALAELEQNHGKSVAIATQNIDGLHQRAGSQHVYELHGSMMSLSCRVCGAQLPVTAFEKQLRTGDVLRHSMAGSTCGGVMKPDIVFYGEMLPKDAYESSLAAMEKADLILVLGTSLAVYPAAGLPRYRSNSCRLVIINRTETPLDMQADLVFRDSIGEVLPKALP